MKAGNYCCSGLPYVTVLSGCLRIFSICTFFGAIFFSTFVRAQESSSGLAQPHPLAQEMFRQGAITCASTAHQLAALMSTGKEVSLLQVLPGNPDGALANATFVQPNEQGTALIGMSFAPSPYSGCTASYRMVVYVEDRCPKTVDKHYPGQRPQELEKTGVLLINPSPKVQALLVPAGKGCLIVSEEIVR